MLHGQRLLMLSGRLVILMDNFYTLSFPSILRLQAMIRLISFRSILHGKL